MLAAALLLGVGWLAWTWGLGEKVATWRHSATPSGPAVVLVVMDATRADRLSVCGYGRPTSPTLQALADRGATVRCDAHAPGSWTLPSHASFFTGQPVTRHGAHYVAGGEMIRQMSVRPLPADLPTLAELMTARGYQAVGVSANPVLVPASGLARGFARWSVAPQFGAWYRGRLVDQVAETLRGLDLSGPPLFLFVNVSDSHDPWFAVPDGLDWVPPHDDTVAWFRTADDGSIEAGEWGAYVTGALSEADAAAFRARIGDQYDYAVWQADHTLLGVLDAVEAHGWTARGLRLVIVADHGEFLGEHGLLQHGHYLWEENQRVALLALDSAGPVVIPAGASALGVHDLVAEGAWPDDSAPPTAVAFPDPTWVRVSGGAVGGATSAALWSGTDKLLWVDGEVHRYDLLADPGEIHPLPAPDSPALDALVAEVRASALRDFEVDPDLIEALRAAGYVGD